MFCVFLLIMMSNISESPIDARLLTQDKEATFETRVNRLDLNQDGEAEMFRIGVKIFAAEGAANIVYQADVPLDCALLGVVASRGEVLDGDDTYPVQVAVGNLGKDGVAWIHYDLAVMPRAGRFFNTIACQGLVEAGNHPNLLTDDPDTAVFADPTITVLGSEPAITALKSDTLVGDINGNGLANPGDTLGYKVEIGNVGTTDAMNTVYRTPLSMMDGLGLVVGSVSTTQGTVISGNNPGDTEIAVDLGTVGLSNGLVITYQGQILQQLPAGMTHASWQGLIEGSNFLDAKTDDPDTAALNDPTRTLLEEEPRILATKRDTLVGDVNGNGIADPGERVRFTTTLLNGGTAAAQGLNFKLQSARNLTLVSGSVTTTQGVVDTGNQPGDTSVTVELGDLGSGGMVDITFETTVVDPLPVGALDGECQGQISGSNVPSLLTDDPDTALFGDATLVPFGQNPVVWVSKTDVLLQDFDGDGQADPGDILEYQINLGNSGNEIATGVSYGSPDGVHAQLVVGSVTTTAGVIVSGNQTGDTNMTVNIGDVLPGEAIAMSFQVVINDPLPPEVTTISCQGLASGDNFQPTPSDDPDTTAPGDPTVTPLDRNPALIAEKRDTLVVDQNGNGVANFGDVVRYTTEIQNHGSGDGIGVRFESGVDPNTNLNVGSVTTTKGQITSGNQAGDTEVGVEIGVIEVGQKITIEFEVTIKNPATSTTARCQGVLLGNGIHVLTDDPDTPAPMDPTETEIEPDFEAFVHAEMTSSVLDQDGDGSLSIGDLLAYEVSLEPGGTPRGIMYRNRPDVATRIVAESLYINQGHGEVVDGEIQVSLGDFSSPAAIYYDVVVLENAGLQIVNQGVVRGVNIAPTVTDDPRTPEPNDPTVDYLGSETVPTLGAVGLTVFTVGILGMGIWKSRVSA